MLEAVSTVLQNAPMIRGNAEQVSNAASFAANPTSVQKVPQAPYISPYIHLDIDLGAVLQIRDSDTGDVVRQIPSEATIEARQRFQQQIDLQQQQIAQQQPERRASAESAAVIAGQAGSTNARPQATESAPGEQQQAARRPAPQAKQIAAFQAAALTGANTGAGVQILA